MSASDGIRSAIEKLRVVARAERIEPDGPLGQWTACQVLMLGSMADLADEQRLEMAKILTGIHAAAITDLDLLKVAAEEFKHRAEEAKQVAAGLQYEMRKVQTATIEALSKDVAVKLKEVMLIRERRWNQVRNWSMAGTIALAGISLFVGGYGAKAYESYQAIRAVDRCLANTVQEPKSGRLFCQVDVMLGRTP